MKLLFSLIFVFITLPGFPQEVDKKLIGGREEVNQYTYNIAEELSKIGHDTLDAAALMDERVILIIQKGLKEAQLHEMDHAEIKALLQERARGGALEKVYHFFPSTLEITAGIMGDRDALPALLGLLLRKQDLKRYFVTAVVLFAIAMLMRIFIIRKKRGALKRTFYSVMLSLLTMTLTLGYFYHLFKYEITPTIRVVKKHF